MCTIYILYIADPRMGPGWGCLEPPSRPAPSDRQEPRPEETSSPGSISQRLDHYYGLVKRQLLRHQSPTSHLFPATSTDTELASIRDSLYCASAVWALGQAYRRLDDDQGKSYELGQAAVACMRGVLAAWTKQSRQLEEWKVSQNPALALHTVVGLHTGEKVVEQYHHLQLDCTSLFLLYLVQMTTAGLEIVYSLEEVALVQNLVYYIERAYRTPDFGTWGRGTKYNDGSPEVHASSIGMAKAALEAVNGFNLFGERGTNNSVIYADIDAHNRNRAIFEALLPRESSTKNTDASLLCAISYPAFATQSVKLYKATKERVVKELSGGWGFKRFVRDGFGTELEEQGRRYYNDGETIDFQGVENEWPIFYIFMIIDGVFKELPEQVTEYRTLLDKRLTSDPATGDPLVPRMYSVPKAAVQEERKAPHSVKRKVTLLTPRVGREKDAGAEVREASPEVFLWGQAVYIIAELLQEGLLHRHELDPIRRYLPCHARHRPTGRYSSFLGREPRKDTTLKCANTACLNNPISACMRAVHRWEMA
jgi:phosphorylase kinase alpha/beta subunit